MITTRVDEVTDGIYRISTLVPDLGGKRVRDIDTPHVRHGWEERVVFEETTATLLCGDLFTHMGNGPPLTDAHGPRTTSPGLPRRPRTCWASPDSRRVRPRPSGASRSSPLAPSLLHGSSFTGDAAGQLRALADGCDRRLARARP